MPNKDIFCNIPWYEIHINHDGSYDLCGCMSELITQTEAGKEWNLRNYPIKDYWNSRRLRDERLNKLGDVPNPACYVCQHQDQIGNHSKRIKENLKSVIFYDKNFAKSFEQSPNKPIFDYSLANDGATTTSPVSYHLSLGNECDLACIMCSPNSSFKLASDYKALGWIADARRLNWTDDPAMWSQVCEQLINTRLVNLHIIGGEPTINKRFHQLIDTLIAAGHTDYSFSFTTNGMHDLTAVLPKLAKFKRAEISFSIETVNQTNDYIRYGSDYNTIIQNISVTRAMAADSIDFVIRTVPTFLTVNYYSQLIAWCLEENLLLNSYFAVDPVWQQIKILPNTIKRRLRDELQQQLARYQELDSMRIKSLTNFRNKEYVLDNVIKETEATIASLADTEEDHSLNQDAVFRLKQLDELRGTDVRTEFPMLKEFFKQYGY